MSKRDKTEAAAEQTAKAVGDPAEERSVAKATKLNPRLIYEVVRREGEEELERPVSSLVWSGITAGLLIGFSVIGEAVLRSHLPDRPWRPLVENFGYAFGFLLVIMGRMQLFTENTITTVLPVVARRTRRAARKMVQLWSIVLAANVAGAFVAAFFIGLAGAMPAPVLAAAMEISHHATGMGPGTTFLRAIPAGVLVAAIVWSLPTSGSGAVPVIVLFTWLIAAGDFSHVVAGSVEMALILLGGGAGVADMLSGFFLPALAGNIVGGTVVFTLLAWGQVSQEVVETAQPAEPSATGIR